MRRLGQLSAPDPAERLRAQGLAPTAWSNGPSERYAEHSHGYDKVLVAGSGTITFHLPGNGGDVELRAGERLELPAGTRHAATVGSAGVTCLEAQLPAGALAAGPRHRPAGEW